MLQRPESTPPALSTCRVDLRRIRAGSEKVDDLGIADGIEGCEGIDEKKVFEGSRGEEGVREGSAFVAVFGIIG